MIGDSKKVFVGLSGGVDSAVSAALLKRAGYNVIGIFIKVWSPEWLPCAWPEERRDAMRICATLDIPFMTLDLEAEYKKNVVDYMIGEYRLGRTPNPDVMCNKEIKFGAFYDWAMAHGADFVATGHYARIIKNEKRKIKNWELKIGSDSNKDQSYFLWNLRQDQLPHVLFPVGDKKKDDVRKLAEKFKISVAEKKDSQGICFIGKLDMKEFLAHYINDKPGDILNEKGNVIGKHNGVFFYTLGESFPLPGFEKKLFIVGKDLKRNSIMVSERRPEEVLEEKRAWLESINWISGEPDLSKVYLARVHYRQELQPCHIVKQQSTLSIEFRKQQILNSGQSIVLYDEETCLGGGIIR